MRGSPRTQLQVAVSADDNSWYLLSASPDLPRQIEAFPKLHPTSRSRGTPIAALVLTDADLDQVLGLILLRESQPLRVYATRSVRTIIMENNIIFGMVKKQIMWDDLNPGRELGLGSVSGENSKIRCLPFALSGNYPYYAGGELANSLTPQEAVLGLRVRLAEAGRLIYMPVAPSIEESWLEHARDCDLLLFDGTFWTDDELIRVQGGGRTARQMGHIPISGPDGSLERLAGVTRPRKVYIHVNNTNPILDEDSPEYHRAREAGWEVAQDGMEFNL